MPHTEISIDWLSLTSHDDTQDNLFSVRMVETLDEVSKRVKFKALSGYTEALRWECGAIAMRNENRPEMGVHFIFSGDALRNMTALGYDALFIMTRAAQAGCKFTIIHLAMDVFNYGYSPAQLSDDFYQNRYKGRSRNGSQASEKGRGYTAYVGSWNSDRFFRYYDKAAEQNTTGDWKRLELILKDNYARAFAWELGRDASLPNIERVLKGTVKTMANFHDQRWQDFMSGESSKLAAPKTKKNSTRNWLLTQVVSAMARYMVETGDVGIVDDMGAELTAKYDELIKSK